MRSRYTDWVQLRVVFDLFVLDPGCKSLYKFSGIIQAVEKVHVSHRVARIW